MDAILPRHLQKNLAGEFERYWLLHCPFHKDLKPSMLVYKSDGFYICKSCERMGNVNGIGAGGEVVTARRQVGRSHLHLPTEPEAIGRFVEVSHRLLVKYPDQGLEFRRRGIADRIIPRRLGWWEGWFVIPVINRFGIVTGMYLRATPQKQKATGQRFTQPKGQSPMLYVPDWERVLEADYCLVVFGWADALTMDSLGYPVATTTGGKDEFDPEWVSEWRKRLFLIPDAEEEDSMSPLLRAFGWRGRMLRLNYPPGAKDPNGFLEVGKSDLLRKQLRQVLFTY